MNDIFCIAIMILTITGLLMGKMSPAENLIILLLVMVIHRLEHR